MKLHGAEVVKVDTFKFESQSKGCQGGIGDRGIAARLKNVYMIIMRPVKMYGLDMFALTYRQGVEVVLS